MKHEIGVIERAVGMGLGAGLAVGAQGLVQFITSR